MMFGTANFDRQSIINTIAFAKAARVLMCPSLTAVERAFQRKFSRRSARCFQTMRWSSGRP
jgi:hypothetical protein